MSSNNQETYGPRRSSGVLDIGSGLPFSLAEMATKPAAGYGLFEFQADFKAAQWAELEEWQRCYSEVPLPSADAIEARGVQARESAKLAILQKACLFDATAKRPTAEEWASLPFSVVDALIKKQSELNRVSDVLGESERLSEWVRAQAPTPSTESSPLSNLPDSASSGSSGSATS